MKAMKNGDVSMDVTFTIQLNSILHDMGIGVARRIIHAAAFASITLDIGNL